MQQYRRTKRTSHQKLTGGFELDDWLKSMLPFKKKNKAMLILGFIFLSLAVADIISSLSLGELLPYLEANPIYHKAGIWGIALLNVLLVGITYFIYTKVNNITWRYAYINYLVSLCVIRVFVIYGNIQTSLHPPTLEEAIAVTPEMKAAIMGSWALLTILPYFIGMMSFWIFRIDHKIQHKVVRIA